MGSSKTTTRTIRIKNETADYFKDKPLNRIVESVHDLARKNEVSIKKSGEIDINK